MRRLIAVIALASAATWSCVVVVSPEERPCPCARGYQCCEAIGVCVLPDRLAALGCTTPDGAVAGLPADARADAMADAAAATTAPDGPGAALDAAGEAEAGPPAAASLCENGALGLQATYFEKGDWSGHQESRVETALALHWGRQAPHAELPAAGWSALFAGQLQPAASETYTFALQAAGGARVWIDGELLIDWWRRPFHLPVAASLPLQAGRRHDLLVEYVHMPGDAALSLRWQSPSTEPGVIAQCHLFPGAGRPGPCGAEAATCVLPGPACLGAGTGLRATYFQDHPFRAPVRTALETVSTYVDGDTPELPQSVRWEGLLEPPVTGWYTFYLLTAGRAQLILDDDRVRPVVQVDTSSTDGWLRERQGQKELVARRKVKIVVEHQQGNTFSTSKGPPLMVHLRWKAPGGPKTVLEPCFLYPPEEEP